MKIDVQTAARTVNYLKRIIPRGQQEADELHALIELYERSMVRRVVHQ